MEGDYMGKDLKGKEIGKGICQMKNKSYQGRYVDRFGNRKSVYGKTVKEVKNKMAAAIADNLAHRNVVDEKITLNKWYEMWMDVYKIPYIRQPTKKYYAYIYESNIKQELGKEKLVDLTKMKITHTLNTAKKKGYSWETLSKIKIMLVDMLDRAMEDDLLIKNPARGVRIPMEKEVEHIKTLSIQEQTLFFECSAGTFYDNLYIVAVNTGLRPGELFALTEKSLDFNEKKIIVNQTLAYDKFDGDEQKTFYLVPPKTKSSIREVPMNSACVDALRKQLLQHKIVVSKSPKKNKIVFADLIFTTKFGTPLNSEILNHDIYSIVDEINLKRDPLDAIERISGHSFRHTFATRCFEAGISPKTVQAYLGHATLQMTMDLYTSVLSDKKNEDMALLEKYMKAATLNVEKNTSGKIVQLYGETNGVKMVYE